jgi:hypothetical protein
MKTARGFVRDELGATMPLAMAMIVILGIMGAGLLTFVGRDLIPFRFVSGIMKAWQRYSTRR